MELEGHGIRNITRGLAVFGAGALALHAWRLGMHLVGPPKRYRLDRGRLPPADSVDFGEYLSAITDAQIRADTHVSVLRNGETFYPAELEAVRGARESVNLEAYEFLEGELTRELLDALVERARAGVEVRMVVDAIGSWETRSSYFDRLRAAGGRFEWYHPIASRNWPYLNNRTHRKLLVIDGRIGFIGGAGFADPWFKPNAYGGPWRDTVLRIEGGAVAGLNAVFSENWLETTGEILAARGQFRTASTGGEGVPAMVVTSTPQTGTTRARILYQALIEAAREKIHITTPYFVPDRSARKGLEAAAERGIEVIILTNGRHSDHPMTRRVSRVLDRRLVKAGAEVYEYEPSLIHAKLMTIDGVWTVAGSSNFDHRSFDLNDEVNLAVFDRAVAARIEEDFARDLGRSRRLTPARLRRADAAGRMLGAVSWVVRREQ